MFSKETIQKFQNTPTPFYYDGLELLSKTLHTLKKESDKYVAFMFTMPLHPF